MYRLTIEKQKENEESCSSRWQNIVEIDTEFLDVPALLDFILKSGSLREHSPTIVTDLKYWIEGHHHDGRGCDDPATCPVTGPAFKEEG